MKLTTRLAGGVAIAIAVAPWIGSASAFAADDPPAGDDRATYYAGNIHDSGDSTACAQLLPEPGFPDDSELAVADSSAGSQDGIVVTSDGQFLTITDIPSGTVIDATVVKGGPGYNVYPGTALTDLHAPLVGNPPTNIPVISHWFLCYHSEEQPLPEAPSATVEGDCDSATFTLVGGSAATDFTLSRPDDADQTIPVDAGATKVVGVDLDADHPTATVSADGMDDVSFTRDESCDVVIPPGDITNPAATARNSCADGISVTLSNMDATEPVTFTLTDTDGATQDVTVQPEQIVKRSFAVTEDTTGKVTVTAPGMDRQTFKFAKDCTAVLGEKEVRTPDKPDQPDTSPAVLPFTGSPTENMLVAGLASALAGLVLLVAARRRRSADGRS